MSLSDRIWDYDKLCSRFTCERPSKLISTHQIEEKLWQKLQVATAIYMSRCLPSDEVILDEEALLDMFEQNQASIRNITPNGLIVPKKHTILEYNTLIRTFAEVIDSLKIEDLILSWHIPPSLRIKFGEANKANLERSHPTESIHADSWVGESPDSVTVHIPIFGDLNRNYVAFYEPPEDFQENRLKPLQSYADGAEIAAKYTKLDFAPGQRQLILADFASLHMTTRLPRAGSRVSIDTNFHLKRQNDGNKRKTGYNWQENERTSHNVLMGLGQTHLLFFPDDVNQMVLHQSGSNLKVLEF